MAESDPSEPDGPPRRGIVAEEPPADARAPQLKPWLVALGAGLVLATMVLAVYLARGAAPMTTRPEPGPSAGTSTPSPRPDPTGETQQTASTRSAPVSSPGDVLSPKPEGDASGPVDLATIQLDDATFILPGDWELYADDIVDGSRRLVRIREPLSDVRAQFVSLTSVGPDLSGACQALIDDQGGNYTNMVPVLPAAIGLATTEGTGVTCGFRGTRTRDAQDNSVTFTLLQRTSDGNSLVLRSTVPASVTAGSPARAALFAINCQASSSFGVPLPLC
ncbi:MAG TPA: hypothetical protein PKE40_08335 [Arachnia sp.]|nr:hypothetical protein [Arachnia sp.]HMT86344.1 hypothetical protein [Arachnia sp.]